VNHDELSDRLRAIGDHPIDSATGERHRNRIAATKTRGVTTGRRRFSPLAVAAAGVVGFLVGSTGLAMAGALPDPAQNVAHDVLGVVQVEVPAGRDGTRGACVSEAAKIADEVAKQETKDACPKGGREGTRGACVSEAAKVKDEVAKQDAKDACPKGKPDRGGDAGDAPGRSGDAPGQKKDKTKAKHVDDPCRGRPAWAGQMSPEDRAEAKAANSREGCPDDADDADVGEGSEDDGD